MANLHHATVQGFGDEWSQFDQTGLPEAEREQIYQDYFWILPPGVLHSAATGFDLGSGSGRWAQVVAPQVGHLHCIDISEDALNVARKNLAQAKNISFHLTTIENTDLQNETMDFGYSLGVLHHLPDTQAALTAAVQKLKSGGWFLLYLYYRFDNAPFWFRTLWQFSDVVRRGISRLPFGLRSKICEVIAALVYWPLARGAALVKKLRGKYEWIPLSYYHDKSFYTMRTDALDRFGTQLEQRFTRKEIEAMMQAAGLTDIRFSDSRPFWVAAGQKT